MSVPDIVSLALSSMTAALAMMVLIKLLRLIDKVNEKLNKE